MCDVHVLFWEKFPVIVPRALEALGYGILRMYPRLEQGLLPNIQYYNCDQKELVLLR